MNKTIKILLFSFILIVSNNSNSIAEEEIGNNIAVMPISTTFQPTVYNSSINLIANDITHYLNKKADFTALDIENIESKLKKENFYKKYEVFLADYKATHKIHYNTCAAIASKINSKLILLVSGGFDLQDSIVKPNIWYRLNFPDSEAVKSYYKLKINLTLIDPFNSLILWEKSYDKSFRVKNIPQPSQFIFEDAISSEKIKKFSKKIAINSYNYIDEEIYNSTVTKADKIDNTSLDVNLRPIIQNTKLKTDSVLDYKKSHYKKRIEKQVLKK